MKTLSALILTSLLFAAPALAKGKNVAVCNGKFTKGLKLVLVGNTLSGNEGHTKTNYARMKDADAAEFGFTLADSQVVYFNGGDDDVPNQYIIVPFNFADLSAGQSFTAQEGSNPADDSFRAEDDLFEINCVIQ